MSNDVKRLKEILKERMVEDLTKSIIQGQINIENYVNSPDYDLDTYNKMCDALDRLKSSREEILDGNMEKYLNYKYFYYGMKITKERKSYGNIIQSNDNVSSNSSSSVIVSDKGTTSQE